MPVRELIPTTLRTEFGDVLDSAEFYDVGGADRDLTFVPGFSDMRRARDLALADIASGKRKAHEVEIAPLPVNCRWTRTTTVKGEPDGRKQIASGNLGYTAVNKDQIGKVPWLTALPPGATIDADGGIRKGDTILMVADGKTAGRNVARRAAATQRLGDAASSAKGGLVDVAGKTKGADPFIRKEG
jgi:hypothetical protein